MRAKRARRARKRVMSTVAHVGTNAEANLGQVGSGRCGVGTSHLDDGRARGTMRARVRVRVRAKVRARVRVRAREPYQSS